MLFPTPSLSLPPEPGTCNEATGSGSWTWSFLLPLHPSPAYLIYGWDRKEYDEKGKKAFCVGAIIPILPRWLLADWLIADALYVVLQRPCRERLKSSSVWSARLGFQSLQSMMPWLLHLIKIMAPKAAVVTALALQRKTWHLFKFPTNDSKVGWTLWYLKCIYLVIRIWKDQFLWRLELSSFLF